MIVFFNFIITTIRNTITYFFNISLFNVVVEGDTTEIVNITFGDTILYFGLVTLAIGFFLSFFKSAGKSVHSYAAQQRYDK